MSSKSNSDNKIYQKGGAEKARLKRALLLKAVANDPNQKKLCFSKSTVEVNILFSFFKKILKIILISIIKNCYNINI